MANLTDSEKKDIRKEFDDVVNMTPGTLQRWLDTKESGEVGQVKEGETESTGHQSGKRILAILAKKQADLTDDDYTHMRNVVSYVRRHSAQRPAHVPDSNWLYSLKNWGHDPEK